MKKLIAICFSMVFILYSFVQFYEFDTDSNDIMIDDKIKIGLGKYESAQKVEKLIRGQFVKESISMTYIDVDKDGDKYIYTYYKTDDTFSDIIKKETDEGYLAPGPGEYYSTVDGDFVEGCVRKDMPISNLTKETVVFNWDELRKKNLSIGSIFVPKDKADKALEILKSVGFSEAEIMHYESTDSEQSTKFNALFFPVCGLLICVFLYVLLNAKQYALQRMEGYSSKHIVLQEFKSVLLISISSYFVVDVISLVVAKIIFNNAAFWNFYHYSRNTILFAIIISAIIFLIIAALIYSEVDKNYIDYVKGRTSQKTAYTTTIIAKSAFLLSMITALSISLRCLEDTLDNYRGAKTLEEKVAKYVVAYPEHFKISGPRGNMTNLVEPFLTSKKDIFIDLYHKVSNEYNGFYCSPGEKGLEFEPVIDVSRNYFNENPIFLENGERLKVEDLDKDRRYILYPPNKVDRKYEEMELWEEIHEEGELEPIFLTYDPDKSKVCAYDLNYGKGPENLMKDPEIGVYSDKEMLDIIKFKDIAYPRFAGMFCGRVFFIKAHTEDPVAEITPMLKEMFNWDFKVESLAKSFYDRTFDARDLFLRSLINSLLFMAATLCFIFASAKLYCENHKKRISQALVDGFSLWRCIKTHVLAIIATNVFIGLLLLASRPLGAADSADIRVIVACLVADLVISIALCAKYARANLQKILKGADV